MEPVLTGDTLMHRLIQFTRVGLLAHTEQPREIVVVAVFLVGSIFLLKQ